MHKLKKTKETIPEWRRDMGRIDWDKLAAMDIDLGIPRKRAKGLSDTSAADQIVTALHEAIHLIVAVMHEWHVWDVSVSHRVKGDIYDWRWGRVQGQCGVNSCYDTWMDVESSFATALFEVLLDPRPGMTPAADVDEDLGFIALRAVLSYDQSETRGEKEIIDTLATNLLENWIPPHWALIRIVAIAILLFRDTKNGTVSQKNTQRICRYVDAYFNYQIHGLGDKTRSMSRDIEMLAPLIQKHHDKFIGASSPNSLKKQNSVQSTQNHSTLLNI